MSSTTATRPTEVNAPYRQIHVSTLLLDSELPFRLYAHIGDEYLLYRRESQPFTERQRDALISSDFECVYVHHEELPLYWNYLRTSIGHLLSTEDDDSEAERSSHFYDASTQIAQQLVTLPVDGDTVVTARQLVGESLKFQTDKSRLHGLMGNMRERPTIFTHALNVCQYGLAFGRQVGLTQAELEALGLGLLLMDLGMLAVPEDLLFKSGPLSFEEWDIIKRHPATSLEMLGSIPNLPPLTRQVIFSHHEKLDGTGYPQGLTAEEIPLPVRIASITDAFCSLTSHREYRKAHTTFDALRVLHTEFRGKFDAELLREFTLLLAREEPGS